MSGVRAALERLFRDTIARVEPAARVAAEVRRADWRGPVTIVAAGKAAVAMALGACAALGERVAGGVVVAPAAGEVAAPLALHVAAHPVPDARSVAAAEAAIAAVEAAPGEVLALISGGASALLCAPASGVTLAEKVAEIRRLAASGAAIAELNAARIRLSAIKGGRLAARASARVTTLVASDVVGDDPAIVGSGPTVPGRPGDRVAVVAGIGVLVDEAVAAARAAGHDARAVARDVTGDVTEVAERVAGWAGEARPGEILVAGGEPTVRLCASPGTGGRAHHLALLVAERIAGRADVAVLCAGSDGIDGTTDAAGAIACGTTWDAVDDPRGALARCDTGPALAAIGATLVTGPTGVNHADLIAVARARPKNDRS